MSDDATPGNVPLSDLLGPLPEADLSHRKALDDCDEETSYSADAMEAERQRCYALGVTTERARCVRICEEHAADKNPPFKDYEDNYRDGWLDAANECGWAIQGPNAALTGGEAVPVESTVMRMTTNGEKHGL